MNDLIHLFIHNWFTCDQSQRQPYDWYTADVAISNEPSEPWEVWGAWWMQEQLSLPAWTSGSQALTEVSFLSPWLEQHIC